VYEQYKVQPHYDSMVAKLICWADKREVAIERMKRALDEYVIEGINTNIPFLKRVLVHPGFVAGKYDTRIVEQILAEKTDAAPAAAASGSATAA
jgi:acetyl-CoA carboxylase biotin carboxylase subunit